MNKKRSSTITASIIAILSTIFLMAGIPILDTQLTEFAETITSLIAQLTIIATALKVWYERKQKGDVKVMGGYIKDE